METTICVAKTVIVGASNVGKTCIANRYFSDIFDDATLPTMGSSFYEGYIKLSEDKTFKYEVWDTAGQEHYMSLAPVFFKEATIAILVYDITRSESLTALDYYVKVLTDTTPNCFIAVVGNKIDLCEKRMVEYAEGLKYSEKINSKFFVETSALTGEGVNTLFETLAKQENLCFSKKKGQGPISALPDQKKEYGCC